MSVVDDLCRIAGDKEKPSYQRRRAVQEMAGLPSTDVLGSLVALLSDDDRYLRRDVVAALVQMRGATVVPVLIQALKDADDCIRGDAARALGDCGDDRAVKPLEDLREDSYYLVRDAAKSALSRIKEGLTKTVEASRNTGIVPDDGSAHSAAEESTTRESEIESAVTRHDAVVSTTLRPPEISFESIPEGFSWEQSRRMQLFFGDDVGEIQSFYEQLRDEQTRLTELEDRLSNISMQLSLQRADKEDDLAGLDETLSSAESSLRKLERELFRTKKKKISLENRLRSFLYRLARVVWPNKREKIVQQIAELENKKCEIARAMAKKEDELRSAQRQHDDLLHPLKTLQEHVDEVTAEKDVLTLTIHTANSEIGDRVVSVLRMLKAQDLKDRLKQLCLLASDTDFLAICATGLTRGLFASATITVKVDAVRDALADASASLEVSVAALGKAIASGFEVTSSAKRAAVQLKGSVGFEEESSFFGGYSGASGSASGSGSGEGMYSVEEIRWEAPDQLTGNVASFTEASASVGEKTAELEALTARKSAYERCIVDYAHLIRTELELDFGKE